MQSYKLASTLHHVPECKYRDATHCKFDANMVSFFIFADNANLWTILGEYRDRKIIAYDAIIGSFYCLQ
jgi:hypothetical protein